MTVMEKYFERKSELELSRPIGGSDDSSKQSHIEINMLDLHSDPGLRPHILDYNLNIRDEIIRAYLQKGLVGLEIMVSLKINLEKSQDDSTRHCVMNSLIGWNIASKKMLHFAYVVIFLK